MVKNFPKDPLAYQPLSFLFGQRYADVFTQRGKGNVGALKKIMGMGMCLMHSRVKKN